VSDAPLLVDSHCHVAEPEFDPDRAAVLARAAENGVTTLVCVGATGAVEGNAPAVALAGRHGAVEIVATVGIHPHNAASGDDAAFATLERFAAAPGVVAIGETGLDFHYDFSPRPAQLAAFARSIALARRVGLPVVVHVREAHVEAADVLRAEGAAEVGGVIHCFTGDAEDAARYLDLGLHISVSGIVTFKNADALRDAVRRMPADRLLVETDAPYLAPVPHRGRRNEPAWVRVVAETVATVRGQEFAAIALTTTTNARRLFQLSGP
jgi:TatD DNase family protein